MTGQLSGKVAIITGGSSGIGAKSAELFVQEGARVVIAARRLAEGEALAARLGPNALFHATDVSDESQVQSLVRGCVEKFGRLDCIFNNAGNTSPACGIADTKVEDLDEVLRVHLRGVMLGMKYAAPVMLRQGSGSIINTGSLAGSRSGFSSHAYCAAMAGVIHLSQCVAVELGEGGVRVNSISPGPILTGIFAKAMHAGRNSKPNSDADDTGRKLAATFAAIQPIRRAGMPDDVARVAVFLASDASAFMSGKDLIVDGGNVGGYQWSELMRRFADLRTALTA
jgi:NAD(P)-dependent dehydrogenase (short-subunit alcohol dehydrogenase family)